MLLPPPPPLYCSLSRTQGQASRLSTSRLCLVPSLRRVLPVCLGALRSVGVGDVTRRTTSPHILLGQVDDSTTRVHGGTGLGLAISRKIVNLWSGKLWVSASDCQASKGSTLRTTGTTFSFTMPVLEPPRCTQAHPTPQSSAAAPLASHAGCPAVTASPRLTKQTHNHDPRPGVDLSSLSFEFLGLPSSRTSSGCVKFLVEECGATNCR